MKQATLRTFWIITAAVLLLGIATALSGCQAHSMEMERDDFIEQKELIIGNLITKGNYKCCLEKPCTYCIEKSPGHSEGATCNCLEDVVTGKHPCGECIGEIMESHGNPYLAEYFAQAIAEEVGKEHLETLQKIIEEKYEMAEEDLEGSCPLEEIEKDTCSI